ncbi:DUF1214 domain-containing protein [Variovorax robiniae]|uniref:DUF1214 domain-containing protein n=1 Tax=Variovorax robiniae TaxID=1836199 RepID=A0ABU8XJF2_9BURK
MKKYWHRAMALLASMAVASAQADLAEVPALSVTPDNFIRAETDRYFANVASYAFGKLRHYRDFVPLDKVAVVRINRDTLYSVGVFDLDAGPVTVTLPDTGKRYISLVAYSEDHYASPAIYKPGSYTFSREQLGTRYAMIGIRTLFDPASPTDRQQAHAVQDAIQTRQDGIGRFEVPAWDAASLRRMREALFELGKTVPDSRGMFGNREQVAPVRRLIGSAIAWGGNNEKDALYLNVTPSRNDGATVYRMHVKDVPVDGFWSVSVYDERGFFKPNPQEAYTLNDITAKRGADGSVDIQFGGCDGQRPNCLPTMPGWNYMVRLYQARPEVLSGAWTFPQAQPVTR